jgi:hypothetical protein
MDKQKSMILLHKLHFKWLFHVLLDVQSTLKGITSNLS